MFDEQIANLIIITSKSHKICTVSNCLFACADRKNMKIMAKLLILSRKTKKKHNNNHSVVEVIRFRILIVLNFQKIDFHELSAFTNAGTHSLSTRPEKISWAKINYN